MIFMVLKSNLDELYNQKVSSIKEMSDKDTQIIGNVLVDKDNILRKNYLTPESGCEYAKGFTRDECGIWERDYRVRKLEYIKKGYSMEYIKKIDPYWRITDTDVHSVFRSYSLHLNLSVDGRGIINYVEIMKAKLEELKEKEEKAKMEEK